MSDAIQTELREQLGTANTRRLRRAGQIPANVYGHGEDNVNISLPAEAIRSVVRAGSRVIELSGAVDSNVLISNCQWDALGSSVLHMDLIRISADEVVEVSVSIELRGSAPGTSANGVVRHLLHETMVACPGLAIPEKLEMNINSLEIDETLTLADIEMPENVSLLSDPNTPVVTCVIVEETDEEDPASFDAAAEPELIGQSDDDEDDGEEE